MSNSSKINKVFNILIILIIGVVLMYFYQANSLEKDKLVEQEDIICLVAVCINEKGVGDQCYEFDKSLALVSVTRDINIPGGKRIIIEPSLRSCGATRQGK